MNLCQICLLILLHSTVIMKAQQGLQLKFYNKTGKDIDSLTIGERYIGSLKYNQSTEYLYYTKIFLFSGSAMPKISGRFDNIIVNYDPTSKPLCNTFREWRRNGKYEYDLYLNTNGDGLRFYLNDHILKD